MKLLYLAITLILFTSTPAWSQTSIGKQQANQYYASCKSKRDPRMSEQTQDAFCACTSAHMMENMSVEDVQIMAGNDQAARGALNKMLVDVYAPCMSYPVEDLIFVQCQENPNIKSAGLLTPQNEICDCMARDTAQWFIRDGRTLLKDLLKENPNIYDPIGPVMESTVFKRKSHKIMMSCLNGG